MKVKVIPLFVFCVIAAMSAMLFWPDAEAPDASANDTPENMREDSEHSDEPRISPMPSLTIPYPKTGGDSFVDLALAQLEMRTSIEASINLKIRIPGETLAGAGSYTEFWRADSTRFEFDRMFLRWELYLRYIDPDADPDAEADAESSAANSSSSSDSDSTEGEASANDDPELYALLRVREPSYVWEYRKFGGAEECVRLDLVRIAQTLEERNISPTINQINAWPELGGLHRMLKEFRRHYEFDEKVEDLLLRGEDDSLPVLRVTGRRRVKEGETEQIFGSIPMPDHISIAFGRDNYFPYRLEFSSVVAPAVGQERIEESSSASRKSMLVVEFREVTLDGDISEDLFTFVPSNLPSSNPHGPRFVEGTEEFLKEYGLIAE